MKAHTSLRTIIVCLLVASTAAVGTSGVGSVSAASQQAGYSVDVVFPTDFSTGENQTIGVTIDNSQNTNDVFSPVVEVPLTSINLSTAAVNNVYVSYDGQREVRRAEIQNSTLTDGDSLFIFGENVPAGEERTYYFNVTIDSPGNHSVTAEARPLYNEDVNVQTQEQAYAKGHGTLSISVISADGSSVNSAQIAINGSTVGEGNVSQTVLEGTHRINLTNIGEINGETRSTVTVSVSPFDTKQVTFIVQDQLSDPQVLLKEGPAQIVPGSTGEVTQAPTAVQPKTVNVSFFLSTSGTETVVGLAPPLKDHLISQQSVMSTTGTINQLKSAGQEEMYKIKTESDTEIIVQYVGYKLGDANHNQHVTRDDAAMIGKRIANQTAAHAVSNYGDVNDDGKITPVDAMLIAQYTSGNRTATYEQEGSQ